MSEEKEILPVKTELQKKENLIFRAFKKIKNMDKKDFFTKVFSSRYFI